MYCDIFGILDVNTDFRPFATEQAASQTFKLLSNCTRQMVSQLLAVLTLTTEYTNVFHRQ